MRKIVLCGLGAIQKEMEYMIPQDEIDGYLCLESEWCESAKLPVWTERTIGELREEKKLFIICVQNGSAYERILDKEGYDDGTDYISYKDYYLLESDLSEVYSYIKGKRIAVYGAGNSYQDYKEFINTQIGKIEVLLDGDEKKQGQTIDGLTIKSIDDVDNKDDLFFVVTSTFYPVISEMLEKKGKKFLKDFIYVDTLYIFSQFYGRSHVPGICDIRERGEENLLILLAGYKDFLWEEVSKRVAQYTPADTDVCVVTAGIYSEAIRETCARNGWTYLYTEENKISLALNSTITLHKRARYIYKMDEDIFITKNVLAGMKAALQQVQETSYYEVGFVSPLIPVNAYGYVRILEKLGLTKEWEERFGEIKYTDGMAHHQTIWKDSQAARFLWGETCDALADIDALAERLQGEKEEYSICPMRYSIGLILFERKIWVKMGMFPVGEGNNLGADERHLCDFCMMEGRAIVMAERYIAGHLGYQAQTKTMREYYNERVYVK